jgi:hypothetical protein
LGSADIVRPGLLGKVLTNPNVLAAESWPVLEHFNKPAIWDSELAPNMAGTD